MSVKTLTGKVVSTKMINTVVVITETIKKHPMYNKRFAVHKKYKAENTELKLREGDVVVIEETRPLSKTKNWIVKSKLEEQNN